MGTWSGGTDMLARVVDYVLNDPDPRLPTVRRPLTWRRKESQLGKIDGKVYRSGGGG